MLLNKFAKLANQCIGLKLGPNIIGLHLEPIDD